MHLQFYIYIFSVYLQEIGRAGRDDEASTAILHYNASDISKNVKGMTDEMRNFCTLSECRREYLCEHFGFELSEHHQTLHDCCDNCEAKCQCMQCEDAQCVEACAVVSELQQGKCDALQRLLKEYFEAENLASASGVKIDIEKADQIAFNYVHFTDVYSIIEVFNLNMQQASNTVQIIKCVDQFL